MGARRPLPLSVNSPTPFKRKTKSPFKQQTAAAPPSALLIMLLSPPAILCHILPIVFLTRRILDIMPIFFILSVQSKSINVHITQDFFVPILDIMDI